MIPSASMTFDSKMEGNILSSIKKKKQLFTAVWFKLQTEQNNGSVDSQLGIARTMGSALYFSELL